MRGLLQFFLRRGQFFLFLALEAIAVFMVIGLNRKQGDVFFRNSGNFISRSYELQRGWRDYFRLRYQMDDLSRENAELRRELYQQKLELSRLARESGEFAPGSDSAYRFIPAMVISNTQSQRNNYLTLDRGSREGVEPGMGVISHSGVVGVITKVTDRYAQVMSMLHSQFRLSAGLKGQSHFGTLLWRGGDTETFRLLDIPIHAELSVGDTVETSGFSFTYPKGLPVGKIQSFDKPDGEYFYQISMSSFGDLSNLNAVYVVDHPDREYLEDLNRKPDL